MWKLWAIFLILLYPGNTDRLQAADLSPRQIIDRAVQTDKRLRESRTAYEYDFVLKTQKLDRKDKVLSTRELKARVRPSKEISYTVEILQDSETKSEADKKKQTKQMQEAQQLMTKIELEKLADQYDYVLQGTAKVLNRSCFIIAFSPKPDFKVSSREEKVLHALSGRLWIDQQQYSILKSEASLKKPVAVAWFFATMRELNFTYLAFLLPNGDPAPASFDLFLDVQVSFDYQRQRQQSTMTNYQKSPEKR